MIPASQATKGRNQMAVLDDKVAIVTGSARGIGRATAELLSEHGAKVLINDLDGDVAEQTASRDRRRHARLRRRPDSARRPRRARPEGDRRVGQGRHPRQQRRLHARRADPQDERRVVPADARHPLDRPLPDVPRGRPPHARARQAGARRGPRGVPQDRQRVVDLRDDGQRRPGQLLLRQVRASSA